jgi:hypothetical protein
MEVPKDLGRRIVEASRLAVALHIQHVFGLDAQIGGADIDRQSPLEDRVLSPFQANSASPELAESEAE